jgi:hypothetical protein
MHICTEESRMGFMKIPIMSGDGIQFEKGDGFCLLQIQALYHISFAREFYFSFSPAG